MQSTGLRKVVHPGTLPLRVTCLHEIGRTLTTTLPLQRSALTVHMRVHTGDKPHACQDCGRLFSDSSSLARHRRIHAGLKPFVCEMCSTKSFSRKATLTRHQHICPGRPGGNGEVHPLAHEIEREDEDDEEEDDGGMSPQPVAAPKLAKAKAPKPKTTQRKPRLSKSAKAKAQRAEEEAARAAEAAAQIAMSNLYNLDGLYSSAATSEVGSASASPDMDANTLDDVAIPASLSMYPGFENLGGATFRNSPTTAYLSLAGGSGGAVGASSPGSNPSPRLAQHRRLSGAPNTPLTQASLELAGATSATRSTVQPVPRPGFPGIKEGSAEDLGLRLQLGGVGAHDESECGSDCDCGKSESDEEHRGIKGEGQEADLATEQAHGFVPA